MPRGSTIKIINNPNNIDIIAGGNITCQNDSPEAFEIISSLCLDNLFKNNKVPNNIIMGDISSNVDGSLYKHNIIIFTKLTSLISASLRDISAISIRKINANTINKNNVIDFKYWIAKYLLQSSIFIFCLLIMTYNCEHYIDTDYYCWNYVM